MIPSHQAPVIPLKRWRPHWFSGLALVLGTLAPDLVFILRLDQRGSAQPGGSFQAPACPGRNPVPVDEKSRGRGAAATRCR